MGVNIGQYLKCLRVSINFCHINKQRNKVVIIMERYSCAIVSIP